MHQHPGLLVRKSRNGYRQRGSCRKLVGATARGSTTDTTSTPRTCRNPCAVSYALRPQIPLVRISCRASQRSVGATMGRYACVSRRMWPIPYNGSRVAHARVRAARELAIADTLHKRAPSSDSVSIPCCCLSLPVVACLSLPDVVRYTACCLLLSSCLKIT